MPGNKLSDATRQNLLHKHDEWCHKTLFDKVFLKFSDTNMTKIDLI